VLGIGRDRAEVEVLTSLLIEKVVSGRDTGQVMTVAATRETLSERAATDPQLAFVKLQFAAPMRNYTRWGGWYGLAFTVLSVAALVAGLASSGIAAGWSEAHWARWTILVLGLIAAVSAVVNQVWRPGQKSSSRTKGGNALRREAWEYLNDRNRYTDLDHNEAFGLFVDQVAAIVREAEEIDETPPPTPSLEQA
jgi:uncharacterized membrane protein YcjF (UPF0283 family)